jgi:serine/threonine protein kinase/WD40 repeat protein
MALASGTRLGPYEIVEPLGSGGMGEVYRARDPRLGREVAIKLVATEGEPSPDRLRRFETEARAAAALSHPNVVTVFDVGTHGGHPYLVLELLEGETLRETLRSGVPALRQAVTWALDISRGLAAAHERGIVHRDLKPENVFLTRDGRVKVLDFGLAKLHETLVSDGADRESPTATNGTSPGVLLGTIGYMSPEQVKGETPDARTDVFALGTLLYELVTGRKAFSGSTAPEVLASILRDEPPALESQVHGVPASLEAAVRRCLGKRPSDRFSSARGVEAALETVLAGLEPSRVSLARPLEPRGPYPGLSSFTEADAGRFFGREAEVESLWAKLRQRKLLALIGPSGAGKTSFVRAGLVPSRPSGWGAIVSTPGGAPMRSLAQALVEVLPSDAETMKQLLGFDEPDVAFSMVRKWRESHLEAVLVVDQLEELFTLNPPEVQERFTGLLGRLAGDGDVHVLLSLRDDFLMRCDGHDALRPVFGELTPLSPLTPEGLRRALTEPAKREGFAFEDEALVAEMLESLQEARGALPLLAFAVARLWEKRDRERKLLTRKAYEEIGGVAGALAQHAEHTLERIGLEREPIVRELFRNLVTAQWTRAVADREELLSVLPDREAGGRVLDQLIDARLLTSYEVREAEGTARHPERGGSGVRAREGTEADRSSEVLSAVTSVSRQRIEIVHESLLRAWPRLVRWQAQDEEGAVLRDQLKQAARLWEEKSRPDDLLWTGTSEREFELWRDRYPGALTALEDDFAQAMVHRAQRRKRLRTMAVASIVVASLAVAAVVGVSRQQVAGEAMQAEASKLLALAQNRLEDDPTEALALTTASLRLADTRESRVFVVRTLAQGPPVREVESGSGSGWSTLQFSPDGTRLANAGSDEQVRVWTEDGQGPVRLPVPAGKAEWTSTGLLVTGPMSLGTTDADAWRAHVWSFPAVRRVHTFDFGLDTLWQVGTEHLLTESLLSGTPEQPRGFLLRSWRLPDGEPEVLGRVTKPPGHGTGVFEPGGRAWLFTRGGAVYRRPLPMIEGQTDELLFRQGTDLTPWRAFRYRWSHPSRLFSRTKESGDIQIWSFAGGRPELIRFIAKKETAPEEPAGAILPEPSGRWVVDQRLKGNREARLWSTDSLPGARPLVLRRSGSWSDADHAFHPAGDWLAASTHALSHLTFWPLHRTTPIVVDGYSVPGGLNRPVRFSHDGQWLATFWTLSEGLRLWPLPGTGSSGIRTLDVPQPRIGLGLEFDPEDRFLFVPRGGGRMFPPWIVPLDGSPVRALENPSPNRYLFAASVSPSGQSVASATQQALQQGTGETVLVVWDVATGERRLFDLPEVPSTPQGFEAAVNSVHFVDETTLYTAGVAGVLRWDLEAGTHEIVFAGEPRTDVKTEMSADGRVALARWYRIGASRQSCVGFEILHPESGTREPLTSFGDCPLAFAVDPSGTVAVTGDFEGVVRVGRLSGGEPHLLFGHEGSIDSVAVSPDLRWVASAGEDNTLRLWPMPDLDEPPLHTLPHDALIAKLDSLTNLRAVRDPKSSTGWTVELGPFPGWAESPTW